MGGDPPAAIWRSAHCRDSGAVSWGAGVHAHQVPAAGVVPGPPHHGRAVPETFAPSGAKSDPSDTDFLLDLLLRHRERLRPLQPDTVETRLLHFLVEERRQTVDERTRESHRLTACLKLYFPQVLPWFDDVASPLVGDLLDRWPNLEQLQRAHPGTLRKFFGEHNCRSAEKNEERIAAIYTATPATKDPAVVEGCALIARGLAALLKTLRANIATFDKRIAEVGVAHPDTAIFASLPGAGAVLVPRLIVAFGTLRDRYQDAYQVQCYSGIAPVTESSGSSGWVHIRFACPKFLRQTFHEFAGCSIQWSEWAKAYYRHLCEEEKKPHHAAVRSLAFKWIRIIFRCCKDGKTYDEEIYMQSLRRRGSLPVCASGVTTNATWKTVAGFQKLSKNKA